jgi:hypothetical protein
MKNKYQKWYHIFPLKIFNATYGQKNGWESNWQFDSLPLKPKK